MTHTELLEKIVNDRQPGTCFIKWWGDDQALVDYEILDRFLDTLAVSAEVEGFELFDMEGIWTVLTELDPDPLSREQSEQGEIIRWVWKDRQGNEHLTTYPFTPEGVMELMESEFFD